MLLIDENMKHAWIRHFNILGMYRSLSNSRKYVFFIKNLTLIARKALILLLANTNVFFSRLREVFAYMRFQI